MQTHQIVIPGCSRAGRTMIRWWFQGRSSRLRMARSASRRSGIWMKAKPRLRPVSWLRISEIFSTSPNRPKASSRSFSFSSPGRFVAKMVMAREPGRVQPARFERMNRLSCTKLVYTREPYTPPGSRETRCAAAAFCFTVALESNSEKEQTETRNRFACVMTRHRAPFLISGRDTVGIAIAPLSSTSPRLIETSRSRAHDVSGAMHSK